MTIHDPVEPTDSIPVPAPMPPAPRPFRFGAAQAILVFAAFVGVQLAVGFFVGIFLAVGYGVTHPHAGPHLPAELGGAMAVLGGGGGLLFGGAAAYWLTRRAFRREDSARPFSAIGWSSGTRRAQLTALFLGVLMAAVYLALANFVIPVREGMHPGLMGSAIAKGGWPLAAWAIMGVAIAPPVEEFVFRGMLWTGLSRSWGPFVAALAVTLVFTLLHVPEAIGYWPALVAITFLGAATLAARLLSRSLAPPVVLHTGYNAIMVAAAIGAYV